jgi:hypothetical protein
MKIDIEITSHESDDLPALYAAIDEMWPKGHTVVCWLHDADACVYYRQPDGQVWYGPAASIKMRLQRTATGF